MPATVTLRQVKLINTISATDNKILVTGESNDFAGSGTEVPVPVGTRLFIDGEMMSFNGWMLHAPDGTGDNVWILVKRGVDGTVASPHLSQSVGYYGRPDQFFSQDPVGRPNEAILVSPHINVTTGSVWFAQGDAQPDNSAARWWQKQTVIHEIGALGVRTETKNPESST